ncbi:AzlC family ABC transporter permease [Collinsella sp. An307]|uniref:AzlC family ABC transporter permease n=1 Tax=Collinsella sp. An307 TaxID=1965630 RepID=UPI002101606B|nr:AzlC family ABC transporter permease [Collinsella sp. An307]
MTETDPQTYLAARRNRARAALAAAFPHTIPILAGFVFLGITCGIYAGSLGLPWWMPTLMSIVIFAGSAEFVVASQLAGAFDPLTTFAVVLIINARHLFYGLSMLERFRGSVANVPTSSLACVTRPSPSTTPPSRPRASTVAGSCSG